jgi:protein gp37
VNGWFDSRWGVVKIRRLPPERREEWAWLNPDGPAPTHVTGFLRSRIATPFSISEPSRILVGDPGGDLFHPAVTNLEIAGIFGIMAACPRHTFLVATRWADRAREWFEWISPNERVVIRDHAECFLTPAGFSLNSRPFALLEQHSGTQASWPLHNVWLGVRIREQSLANRRIPQILECPAALHFVVYRPDLGPLDLQPPYCPTHGFASTFFVDSPSGATRCSECSVAGRNHEVGYAAWLDAVPRGGALRSPGINWLILDGSSDVRAKADPETVRRLKAACADAGVACFDEADGTCDFPEPLLRDTIPAPPIAWEA